MQCVYDRLDSTDRERSLTPKAVARGETRVLAPRRPAADAFRPRVVGIAALFTLATFGLTACADAEPGDDLDGERPDGTAEVVAEGEETPPEAVIPSGTYLTFEVTETVSTEDNSAGDQVELRLVEGVSGSNGARLSSGTRGHAVITEAHESEGPDDEAVLAVQVVSVAVNGSQEDLNGTVQSAEVEAASRASGQRTAATVATGAAAGAILGQILGRDTRSTTAGAAAGAVAGLGIALTTRDGHAVLPEGSLITVRLDQPLRVR